MSKEMKQKIWGITVVIILWSVWGFIESQNHSFRLIPTMPSKQPESSKEQDPLWRPHKAVPNFANPLDIMGL
jgi:hypothetical protein